MPGIDFAELRAQISMEDVLNLIGFIARETSGDQVRGSCPLHHSETRSTRSFSANLSRGIFRCFKCNASGNQLDLYASVTGLRLFEAAVLLRELLDHENPRKPSETRYRLPSADRSAE